MADVQRIREIYNRTNKDMPWPEFLAEFQACVDPGQMRRDLAEIITGQQVARSNAARIDEAIGRTDKPN